MDNPLIAPNLRICHLAKYYPPNAGGIETHVQTLALAQVNLGAEVRVICVNELDSRGNISSRTKTIEEFDGGVGVIRVGRVFSLFKFDFCPEFFKYFAQLTQDSFDIVHLHTPNPTMLLAWLSANIINRLQNKKNIPLVITHHSDIIKQKFLKYILRPFEYATYNQAVGILTDSENYIQGSKFLQTFSNVKALPLGLDCSIYNHPSEQALKYAASLKAKYGEIIWASVGRLVYYKGLDIAIKALALVPGKLIIVGVGGLEQELKNLVQELNLQDRVIWLGKISNEELVGVYHSAKALWFPSNARSEGYGLVQIEAMASGCPVINADIPCSGVTWVSRHKQEGLTIPLNDHLALAHAAQALLDSPSLRAHLVVGAYKRLEEFDHIIMAKRSLEIYDTYLLSDQKNTRLSQSKNYQKTLPYS